MLTKDEELRQVMFNLYLSYACRALCGEGKGQFVMKQLKRYNPQLWAAVMEKAKEVNQQRSFEYSQWKVGEKKNIKKREG